MFENKQQLIDSHIAPLMVIPDEKYDQESYDDRQNEGCGCVMYHYQKNDKGLIEEDDYTSIQYTQHLTNDETWYALGPIHLIKTVAKKNHWPLFSGNFSREDAIKRLQFIKSLNQ